MKSFNLIMSLALLLAMTLSQTPLYRCTQDSSLNLECIARDSDGVKNFGCCAVKTNEVSISADTCCEKLECFDYIGISLKKAHSFERNSSVLSMGFLPYIDQTLVGAIILDGASSPGTEAVSRRKNHLYKLHSSYLC